MSMTREEAIEILENWNLCHYTPSREAAEAVISALDPLEILTALRPVSRERVERIRGEWIEYEHPHIICCTRCDYGTGPKEKTRFCPYCGAPMTDEAVDIIMRRLETLYETT